MLVYQKTMFYRFYCIKSFCHLKSSFLCYYNGTEKHEGLVGFEKACSRAETSILLTTLNYFHFFAC